MKAIWVTLAIVLAGCAGTNEVPSNDAMTAADAVAIYDANKADLGVHEVLGLIAHKGHKTLPWIIGDNSAFTDSHGNLTGGQSESWNLLSFNRGSQEIQWHKIQDSLELVKAVPASALGWNLEYNDAAGTGAGADAELHGGHTCEFLTKFDGIGDSTQFDASVLIYLPSIHTHGDDCARDKPMGYAGLPDSAWYVDGEFFDNQGAALPDAAYPTARLNLAESVDATIPATPVLPTSSSYDFTSEGGLLQIHGRLVSGPAYYNDGTITLTKPDGSTETLVGDLFELDLEGDAGQYQLTFSWDVAVNVPAEGSGGNFELAVQVVELTGHAHGDGAHEH